MQNIGSELTQLCRERDEYKSLYKRASAEVDSLARKLFIEETINNQYRNFFKTNPEYCNWLRDHNAQFEAFKDSPYYIQPKIPTVDNKLELN